MATKKTTGDTPNPTPKKRTKKVKEETALGEKAADVMSEAEAAFKQVDEQPAPASAATSESEGEPDCDPCDPQEDCDRESIPTVNFGGDDIQLTADGVDIFATVFELLAAGVDEVSDMEKRTNIKFNLLPHAEKFANRQIQVRLIMGLCSMVQRIGTLEAKMDLIINKLYGDKPADKQSDEQGDVQKDCECGDDCCCHFDDDELYDDFDDDRPSLIIHGDVYGPIVYGDYNVTDGDGYVHDTSEEQISDDNLPFTGPDYRRAAGPYMPHHCSCDDYDDDDDDESGVTYDDYIYSMKRSYIESIADNLAIAIINLIKESPNGYVPSMPWDRTDIVDHFGHLVNAFCDLSIMDEHSDEMYEELGIALIKHWKDVDMNVVNDGKKIDIICPGVIDGFDDDDEGDEE